MSNIGTVSQLQKAELDVMRSITRTMDNNNIRYYLGYGTLLGAVRHNGFIPWDDDVDLFVPREDYERFRQLADHIIERPYILTGNVINSKEPRISIKVRVENPNIQILDNKDGEVIKQNIWVDIFPIDGMPKTSLGRKFIFLVFRLLFLELRLGRSSRLGYKTNKARSRKERIGIIINKYFHIGKLIDTDKVVNHFEKIRKKFPYESSEYVCPLTIDYMERCICRREWFGSGKRCKFEDTEFNIPDDSKAVLTQFYGDYMQLPPEKDRVLKHGDSLIMNDNL